MNKVWIIDDEESIRTICAMPDLFAIESFAMHLKHYLSLILISLT